MKDSLKTKCELLAENRKILGKAFHFESNYMLQISASMYAENNALADPIKIKNAINIIKSKTNIFSCFRSTPKLIIATGMSLDENPERIFDKTLARLFELKKHFHASTYLPYAAYMLAKYGDNVSAQAVHDIFIALKPLRSLFSLGNDLLFSVIYAILGKKTKFLISDIKNYTDSLSKKLPKYASSTAARIMAIGNADCSERFFNIASMLEEEKCKIGKGYEVAVLVSLSMLEDEKEASTVNKVVEFYDHLKKYSLGKELFGKHRTMYSAIQVYSHLVCKSDDPIEKAAKAANLSIVIAIAINTLAAAHST